MKYRQFILPPGTLIKLGDLPFRLIDEAVIKGANIPKGLIVDGLAVTEIKEL